MYYLLFISILPVFLIGNYIYRKDSEKEPTKLLVKLFFSGIGSFFLTLIITLIISFFNPGILSDESSLDLFSLLIHVFLGIALVEEFSKWIFAYRIGFNNKEFDQNYDIIVYSVFVALGFACIENIFYVFDRGFVTGIFRALFAVPGHACDGVFMGYYLSLAKFYIINGNKSLYRRNLFLSLFIPILFHGFYDYCLFSRNIYLILLFFIFIVTLYIFTFKRLKKVSLSNRKFHYSYKFCPNCGTPVNSDVCSVCGGHNE